MAHMYTYRAMKLIVYSRMHRGVLSYISQRQIHKPIQNVCHPAVCSAICTYLNNH